MIPHRWLIALRLGGRVDVTLRTDAAQRSLAEACLYAIVNRKINSPSRKIAKDGRAKTAIKTTNAIPPNDRLYSIYV